MTELSDFPITRKWRPQHPERLQLYSLPTPNGVKVSIMLEETGLRYEPHLVDFDSNEQASPEYLSLNPYGKIPAIIDPAGPGGEPLPLFESGAILIYLAEKPVACREPRIQHAQQALRFGDVAIARALVLIVATGEFVEKPHLTEHRADAAHLEHEPLQRLVARGRVLRDEAARLLREVPEDRA